MWKVSFLIGLTIIPFQYEEYITTLTALHFDIDHLIGNDATCPVSVQ